jgi:hypothetical protein
MKTDNFKTKTKVASSYFDLHQNEVFISYSRKDQQFVKTLSAAFKQQNRNPWVDWDDIQKGEEWWQAIQRGIEAANTFIFVLSPDSVLSTVCRQEIDHAAQCHKRFLPIVRREGFDPKQVHPSISSHNWLFFRETDDFDSAFQELINAIDTDLDYVRAHTRLLVRALEWNGRQRHSSYLLRGIDLEEGDRWLVKGVSKTPQPTQLQVEYLNASRNYRITMLKARQQARRTIILTTVLANMVLSLAGGFWFYRLRTQEELNDITADMVNALHMGVAGTSGDRFAALSVLPAAVADPQHNNQLYLSHQGWLAKINHVFPNAFARTYIRSTHAGQILWVGDVARDIDTSRTKTEFLEAYDAKHSELEVFNNRETIITTPYTDELGTWISASAPLKNAAGEIVGGIRVDFKEDYLIQEQTKVRHALVGAYLLIFFWLLTLSLIILRATRPLEEI